MVMMVMMVRPCEGARRRGRGVGKGRRREWDDEAGAAAFSAKEMDVYEKNERDRWGLVGRSDKQSKTKPSKIKPKSNEHATHAFVVFLSFLFSFRFFVPFASPVTSGGPVCALLLPLLPPPPPHESKFCWL